MARGCVEDPLDRMGRDHSELCRRTKEFYIVSEKGQEASEDQLGPD